MENKYLFTILTLCVASCVAKTINAAQGRADAAPVRLGVYYESLCPDSIRFMTEQLNTTWNTVQDILEPDLNAYGHITETPTAEGGYEFECQHGPDECAGNIMLTCARKYIADNKTHVDFSLCVMMEANPPTAGPVCAERLGLDFTPIEGCSGTLEGQLLLHDVGVKQDALSPVLDWVPWVLINDEHTDEIQAAAESDLLSLVCSTYEGTPPSACAAF